MPKNILVIEPVGANNISINKFIAPYLRQNEFKVDIAESLDDAKSKNSKMDYHVFITINVSIPETEETRKEFPHIPLIFITDNPTVDGAYLCFIAKVKEYIITPFKFDSIKEAINN